MFVSNMRNVVYSALSSEVSQAVLDHSKQMSDPIGRARETSYWVYASVFADTQEAARAGKFVQGRHRKVKGHDPISRSEYSPSRPDLAVMAHCLIWESNLLAYETYVREFTAAERERYWQEGMIVAELLEIDVETLPQTWEAWRSYYESEVRPRLNYSAAAQQVIAFTLRGSYLPIWARPLAKLVWKGGMELAFVTVGPVERSLMGGSDSKARTAVVHTAGRVGLRLATVPPIRDALERSFGGRAHEFLSEGREIARCHQRGERSRSHTVPAVRQAA